MKLVEIQGTISYINAIISRDLNVYPVKNIVLFKPLESFNNHLREYLVIIECKS